MVDGIEPYVKLMVAVDIAERGMAEDPLYQQLVLYFHTFLKFWKRTIPNRYERIIDSYGKHPPVRVVEDNGVHYTEDVCSGRCKTGKQRRIIA